MINTAIVDKNQNNKKTYSIKELVKLSLEERAKILSPIINQIAEDINNDPEFYLFSHLDGEGIENDD
ncbi:MAG: hypothetical protein GW795_10200 [Cyanobacteria bacterium]|nr:hypothetical protein [Cyanobacteria bacterium CG_2015-16_32_12]NCO78966.1 hypothetical protein [Cyanobacteria bacterium CG_2015-22_32_23]NCQ03093.1 hypothetical protein [Cyanobacteria bacterium CG_2015-09_32_10]NCQ42233.1 hypothetical protein [Cyanobacteria bacterium CG_2015-04_32_10]NCS83752.1 hypothetical protein [Cyanobacteria bacterium CG_2015-02_32_10]